MTCPASGECLPSLNTQFSNVTVTFIGEPPENVPQFVLDFLNEQFEGTYNFLNTEGTEGVDTCDPLFRRVLSVESELGEIATAVPEERRRLDDVGGGFGTFSFNFNIGWGCNGFCPNDNPLFGNDAGRRRQLDVDDHEQHRQLQSIFDPGSNDCTCSARDELRAPTENEFTIELNKRLVNPVSAPAPTASPSGSSQPSAAPSGSHFPTVSSAPSPAAPVPSAPFIEGPPSLLTSEPSAIPVTQPDVFSFGVAQGTQEN